ncbi:MAG: 2Fe-2S iron-sulfur cluster binding domain-containing protein [Gammaproteobacteria bacterium]|nr:MAG: 2Fe-2S iron-sulfur cluster binding domain-containing protein [Gammaproteobacteria bacterium]
MPIIHYIEPNGGEYEVDVPVGNTVMQGAVDNMIDGILAECGGACSCATCHCYVDEAWYDKVGEPQGAEKMMLEMVVEPEPTSRLSCQIKVTEELDGLVVRVPKSQY